MTFAFCPVLLSPFFFLCNNFFITRSPMTHHTLTQSTNFLRNGNTIINAHSNWLSNHAGVQSYRLAFCVNVEIYYAHITSFLSSISFIYRWQSTLGTISVFHYKVQTPHICEMSTCLKTTNYRNCSAWKFRSSVFLARWIRLPNFNK